MTRLAVIFLFLATSLASATAQRIPDSLADKLNSLKTEREKVRAIHAYILDSDVYDSAQFARALSAIAYFTYRNDLNAAAYTKVFLSTTLVTAGDYASGLQLALESLSTFEKTGDKRGVMMADIKIGDAFETAQDFRNSILFFRRAVALAGVVKDTALYGSASNEIAVAYTLYQVPDSALRYAQQAVAIAEGTGDIREQSFTYGTLGEAYIAKGEYDLAQPFLRKSMIYSESQKGYWAIAYLLNDYSQVYSALSRRDSAEWYARAAFQYCNEKGFKVQAQRAYEYMYQLFDKENKQDSANKYFRLAAIAKDSVFSLQKSQNVQALAFREQLRQNELDTEMEKAAKERRDYIQYGILAIGIITFLVIVLLLSRSVIVNERWISFLAVLGLLVVFEFVNLLIHPTLEAYTDHSPILIFLVLVATAAILIPMHHRLEKKIREKMVQKNKRIRLAAAKRTIEKLSDH